MNSGDLGNLTTLVVILLVLAALGCRRGWKASSTAFGTARWTSEKVMRAAGMFAGCGLILGRTLTSQKLISLPNACHTLLVGGSGSGKGVSGVLVQLLTQPCSIIAFDPKADLARISGPQRLAFGQRLVLLAPFHKSADGFNPLDTIPKGSPMLIDDAKALAEALVVRQDSEPDRHWSDKASQTIAALTVFVLTRMNGAERSLNTVQELASDARLVSAAADKLIDIGGIAGRMGSQLRGLFASRDGFEYSREGASIISAVHRHLSFLDSNLVAKAVQQSTFDLQDLLRPGSMSLFIQIPPKQLDAQRGLLRFWLSALFRLIQSDGDESQNTVLCLLDEASALNNLPALEEALTRGRSSGIRLYLAYQSDSQVTCAFKSQPGLIYDNCTTQIYMGGATSIESAERLSRSMGEWTQTVASYGVNDSRTVQQQGVGGQASSTYGSNHNYQPQARQLMKASEILTMSRDLLIALVAGMHPIIARRIMYYADPLFGTAPSRLASSVRPKLWWAYVALALGLLWYGVFGFEWLPIN